MKTPFLTLLILLFTYIGAFASPSSSPEKNAGMHRALCALNAQWGKQRPESAGSPSRPLLTDADWIQHHLRLVEEQLRANMPAGLTAQREEARLRTLDVLHDYRLAGRFPQNETHAARVPVFIDAYGTFCAVGFLLEESGAGALARSVAAKNNFVYLPSLYSPALDAWAQEHGFTRDELAWIQPTYAPMYYAASVGGGTNGSVSELLVSGDGQKLYVGGKFSHVSGSLPAPNIAYVTETAGVYTWHSVGTGLEGQVSALAEWDGNLFAGGNSIISQGSQSGSIAFWNGSAWTMAGHVNGDVHDLAVFRDTLYAAGNFNTSSSGSTNFARWNGAQWISIPGISGTVHTLEAVGTQLFLGGNFRYGTDSVNAMRWSSSTSFVPFANRMANEVRDFEVFKDTVYASCKLLKPNQYFWPTGALGGSNVDMVCRLVGNTWVSSLSLPLFPMNYMDTSPPRNTIINTLCAWNDTLLSGGDLAFYPMIGTDIQGVAPIVMPSSGARWFLVDSALNKLMVFKGTLFAGGRMKQVFSTPLNGLTRQVYFYQSASVADDALSAMHSTLTIHPNPAKVGKDVSVRSLFPAKQVRLLDVAGRVVWSRTTKEETQLSIPLPQAAGHYLVEWTDGEENRASGAVIVE